MNSAKNPTIDLFPQLPYTLEKVGWTDVFPVTPIKVKESSDAAALVGAAKDLPHSLLPSPNTFYSSHLYLQGFCCWPLCQRSNMKVERWVLLFSYWSDSTETQGFNLGTLCLVFFTCVCRLGNAGPRCVQIQFHRWPLVFLCQAIDCSAQH